MPDYDFDATAIPTMGIEGEVYNLFHTCTPRLSMVASWEVRLRTLIQDTREHRIVNDACLLRTVGVIHNAPKLHPEMEYFRNGQYTDTMPVSQPGTIAGASWMGFAHRKRADLLILPQGDTSIFARIDYLIPNSLVQKLRKCGLTGDKDELFLPSFDGVLHVNPTFKGNPLASLRKVLGEHKVRVIQETELLLYVLSRASVTVKG